MDLFDCSSNDCLDIKITYWYIYNWKRRGGAHSGIVVFAVCFILRITTLILGVN